MAPIFVPSNGQKTKEVRYPMAKMVTAGLMQIRASQVAKIEVQPKYFSDPDKMKMPPAKSTKDIGSRESVLDVDGKAEVNCCGKDCRKEVDLRASEDGGVET